jgi:hypothetical protein
VGLPFEDLHSTGNKVIELRSPLAFIFGVVLLVTRQTLYQLLASLEGGISAQDFSRPPAPSSSRFRGFAVSLDIVVFLLIAITSSPLLVSAQKFSIPDDVAPKAITHAGSRIYWSSRSRCLSPPIARPDHSPDLQFVQIFAAGVVKGAKHPEESKRHVEFLASEKATPTLEKTGMNRPALR